MTEKPAVKTQQPVQATHSDDEEQQALTSIVAGLGGRLTVGMITGYCTGYAAKTIGKQIAVLAGISFAGLQYLSYKGYITIHWHAAKQAVVQAVDVNGDGEVDAEDASIVSKHILEILKYQLPGAAGFVGGALYALKN